MHNFVSPVNIGDTIYDVNSKAWTVYSVHFYEKNIALKCSSPDKSVNKTFLIGKKSIGKTIFIGKNAFEESLKAR